MKWIERHFFIPETRDDPKLRGKIQLQPYQRDAIEEAFATDARGLFKYSIIVWSDIKKSAKSTIAAAVNLFRAHHNEFGEFYVIANDLKQADSRVAYYLRRAIQLNPRIMGKYRTVGYKTTAPSGSFIEAIPIDPSGEAGSNADQITFCLDEQTQVLTRDGWKGWEILTKADWIATRIPETGLFEWQKPSEIYCGRYRGDMAKVTHRSMDALVTMNHRMYGKVIGGRGIGPGQNGNWRHAFVENEPERFIRARDAMKVMGYYPTLTSVWKSGSAVSLRVPATIGVPSGRILQKEIIIQPQDYAEFMGWYLSEGCTLKKRGAFEGFSIGQSARQNPNKRLRILELLRRIGFVPHEWAGGMSIAVYHSEMGKILAKYGLAGDKYIPDDIKNMPKELLDVFLKAFSDGDGCRNKVGGILLSSKSERLRDDLAEIAQKCGYTISSAEYIDRRWSPPAVTYSLYLRSTDKGRRKTKVEKRNWSVVPYDGVIFCPSTKNGVIYVRRNGTYYWTGNSELWGANEDAKQTMWAEMTLSPTKHGKSFRWIESYAGFAEESKLLYSLYELGVKQGKMLWPDRLYNVTDGVPSPLELYVNESARMLCLWNTQPRCPWQTKDYYDSERQVLTPAQFDRLHRNQWVTNSDTFVPMEWLYACRRGEADWPKVPPQHDMIIALDAATSNDTFGMWMGCRHPEKPTDILTVFAKRWKPVGGKIDFVGTDENRGPELELRHLIANYNVIQVTYDPYQLHDMATRMKKEGLTWFKPFNQGTDRLLADSQLRDLIRDRRFWYRGEEDLEEHMRNSNAKIDEQESKIRLVKRVEQLKIDLAVCASMGSHNLLYLNL